jgi:hypothetical protein
MEEDPNVHDFDVVRKGISNSRSAFEQYHALLLAKKMLDDNALQRSSSRNSQMLSKSNDVLMDSSFPARTAGR